MQRVTRLVAGDTKITRSALTKAGMRSLLFARMSCPFGREREVKEVS